MHVAHRRNPLYPTVEGISAIVMAMTYSQLVLPNPDIPCQPGWCLQYVRQTFGAPIVEPTATAGWNNAEFKHTDTDFPAGCYVPVWFSLATEPAGHVALMCPDGSVYSTSDNSTVPHHHPSLDDLIAYYWRNPLTYLGWSEDISNVRVVADASLTMQGSVDDLTAEFERDVRAELAERRQGDLDFQRDVRAELAAHRAMLAADHGITTEQLLDAIKSAVVKVEINAGGSQ